MKVVKAWLPLAFAISMMTGLVYVTGQQILRQGANDPQIQLAQDWAMQINDGTLPKQLYMGAMIDPTESLSPFGIVYNSQGKIVASSVKNPEAMAGGVLISVAKSTNTEDRFSW